MKTKPLPCFDLLNYLFKIDEQSPSGLLWKNPQATRIKPNTLVGCVHHNSYWVVTIKRKQYLIHRIIYTMHNNVNIDGLLIDHKNNNGLDNRIENLRVATELQNTYNVKKQINTTSKYKGVSWHIQANKWQARIRINGKQISLGCFEKEEDAAFAYNKAAQKTQKEFACINHVR